MESKYLIFLVGSVVCVPAGILVARNSARILDAVFFALVFSTTQVSTLFGLPADINFLSREWYRGTTRGIEVTYVDLLALIVLVSSLSIRHRERIPFLRPPSLPLLGIFCAWAAFNVLVTSDPKIFGLFELTKIARGILLFTAVAAYIRSPKQVQIFLWALVLVVFYEGAVALQHRYIYGFYRISGTFPHPNVLSMYSLQCIPLLMSAWFARDIRPMLRNLSAAGAVIACATVILSISRTGFAAMLILVAGTFVLNTKLRLSPRNVALAVMALVIASGMIFKSWDAINSRFASFDLEQEYIGEDAGRGSYFQKGIPAIADNPLFGFGLNNWSFWVSNRYAAEAGFSSNAYPGTDRPPERGLQEAPAHSLYLITVAELGWPGLILLLALLGRWLYLSGSGWRYASDRLVDRIRLGAFLSLGGVLMQSVTEWEYRETHLYFLVHITMAVAAVIYQRTREKSRK